MVNFNLGKMLIERQNNFLSTFTQFSSKLLHFSVLIKLMKREREKSIVSVGRINQFHYKTTANLLSFSNFMNLKRKLKSQEVSCLCT